MTTVQDLGKVVTAVIEFSGECSETGRICGDQIGRAELEEKIRGE